MSTDVLRRTGFVGPRGRAASIGLALLLGACGVVEQRLDEGSGKARELAGARVEIGHGGSEAHTLHRVFSGLLLDHGGFVIGDGGTGELRWFDRAGNHLRSVGSRGSGPGEFQSIHWMGFGRADSLLVWDLYGHRFTVLDAEGRVGRSFRPEGIAGPLIPVGSLPDGSVYVVAERGIDPRRQVGAVRDTLVVLRLAQDGRSADSVAVLPGSEWLLAAGSDGYRAMRVPLGESGHIALAGGRLVYAGSEAPELQLLDPTGGAASTYALPISARSLSRRDRERIVRAETEDPVERGLLLRHLASGSDSRAPFITHVVGGLEDRVWVRTVSPPPERQTRWLVVSTSDTSQVDEIALPADAHPLHVTGAALLLRSVAEDGTQRVGVYPLR